MRLLLIFEVMYNNKSILWYTFRTIRRKWSGAAPIGIEKGTF